MVKFITKTVCIALAIILITGILNAQKEVSPYVTPNTGKAYTFEDFVIHSSGAVIKEGEVYVMKENVTISEFDSLIVTDDITVKIFEDKVLTINSAYWKITPPTQAIFTNYATGTYYATIYVEENSFVRLHKTTFTYGSGMRIIDSDFEMDSCTMSNHNFSSTASGAIATTRGKVIVKNSTFKNNMRSAFNSAANIGCTFEITNCYLENNVMENSNRPQISIGPCREGEVTKIINNAIIGNRELTMVGGISTSSLLAIPASYLIEDNTVKDNRYGITLTGMNIAGTIKGNRLTNNNTQNNPNLGGSGINITAPAGNVHVIITENTISGNLWGITLVGNTSDFSTGPTANVGNISVPENDPEYNIGKNIFFDNGNNGELFDLYNNNPNNVMAQNNNWGVSEQTEELIRTVIRDKTNDSRYGTVTFMPPHIITGVNELKNNISIFPNPASSTVTIETQNFAKVEIYKISGQFIEAKTTNIIDVSTYNTGIYFFKIFNTHNYIAHKKVVVVQ
ncbi:MAG: T9SS type A sorting domain-containing protein [Bacteroidetes bacterium]|nr:T9SS type A sorting domain-containing protein [Bacteroidota bacterium]MCL2303270.1 T9SS type A sorting domain-containing protein [Lentimicrobiaceae bacterium]